MKFLLNYVTTNELNPSKQREHRFYKVENHLHFLHFSKDRNLVVCVVKTLRASSFAIKILQQRAQILWWSTNFSYKYWTDPMHRQQNTFCDHRQHNKIQNPINMKTFVSSFVINN